MALKHQLTSLVTVILLFLKCCATAPPKAPQLNKKAAEPDLGALDTTVTRFDEFDWKLCKLVYNATNENVLISPISLKLLLAILYEGAGGETAREIETALHLPSRGKAGALRKKFTQVHHKLESLQESHDYNLLFGTGTFIDETVKLKDEFNGTVKQHYNAKVVEVPFKQPDIVVNAVNEWGKSITGGYIEKFLSKEDISEDEILMMANILFFKGLWQKPFDVRQTEPKVFNLHASNSSAGVKVPFMHTFADFQYLNATDIDAQILKLPYLGEQFSMYIILPNKKLGLNDLMNKLSLKVLREHFNRLTETKVSVALPKFSFDSHTFMKPFLQQLNISHMFSEKANLSKISSDPTHQLAVTNILQRTGMEVDEKGSVAFAITEAHLANKFGDSYAEFFADHPFIFTIEHDKARIPLFTGKLANPASKFSEVESLTPDPSPVPSHAPVPVSVPTSAPAPAPTSAPPSVSTPAPANNLLSHPIYVPDINTTGMAQSANTPNHATPTTDASSTVIPAAEGVPAAAAAEAPAPALPVAPTPPPRPHRPGMVVRPSSTSGTTLGFLRDSHFDTKLLQTIYSTKSNENILLSPASLKMTLALLLEGAGGKTASELQAVMKLPKNIALYRDQLASFQKSLLTEGKDVTVRSANGFFVSQKSKISERYQMDAEHYYRSKVVSVDFKDARKVALDVNSWVNSNTNGVINKLITPDDVSAELKMLLVNTVYFKGKWKLGFSNETTTMRCFKTYDGNCTKVPMMETSTFVNFTQLPSLNTQVVELPYSDPRYSLIIMLPQDATAFDSLMKALPGEQLETILSKMITKKVIVTMPRFSIDHTSELVPVLQSLGVSELFTPKADLSGIFASDEKVAVDKILQKSKIELDEEGAVAASATGSFVIPLSSSTATFDADKPFLFFLHDRQSGACLFEGVVTDPIGFASGAELPAPHPKPQIMDRLSPPSPPKTSRPLSTPRPTAHYAPDHNYVSHNDLSTFMTETQATYNALMHPTQSSHGVIIPSSNRGKPGVAPKAPEALSSKNKNNANHGPKAPVVGYPQSVNYQTPIPNNQDGVLFEKDEAHESVPRSSYNPSQFTYYVNQNLPIATQYSGPRLVVNRTVRIQRN